MSENSEKKKGLAALIAALFAKHKKGAVAALLLLIAGAAGVVALLSGNGGNSVSGGTEMLEKFWPDAFIVKADDEPPFEDDPSRTNNAFNVIDFGAQGSNGWFYRYGDYRKPERSKRVSQFNGEKYFQPGANGLEIKNNFVHTAQGVSPILEWRAAQNGKVDVTVAYVKNVNGDANPSYPDGVQLLVYKGNELQKLEIVPISTTQENFALIELNDLEVKKLESLYFVVNPNMNNAYDGGSFYVAISDVNKKQTIPSMAGRSNNNANSTEDFGAQGSNGWLYMYGTDPSDCHLVSHEKDGEYIDRISPSLTIKKDFIHPSLNHNAVLAWSPAVRGNVDVRLRYTKFEQNDGMPDFPDGVRVKIFKNGTELYNEYVDVPDSGEVLIKKRIPVLAVTPMDMLYFMVDPEGNSSYDGGSLDVTIIDINGTTDESAVNTETGDIRQNIADVKNDFGPQGSNGWIFQSGYGDDPFNARNMAPFDKVQDRYFSDNWLEIKRDYVNTGEHDSSAIIKWRVAQNGTISIRASYTKMKNEDKNPAWPDGTRVSLYANNTLLARQTFQPLTNQEVTKRLDISSLNVRKGDYITMVVNGIDNNAYDGGKYEFAINSLSGLVGNTERNVPATYDGPRTNFASTLDDFNGVQGYNGWYYQYGFNVDPFCAVNIENCENNEKFYTSDGVEIKKDYIVPAGNGKSANVKWVAAETGVINIDLLYTKLLNQDANPSWPDGVTVYLMKNGTVLKKQYFAPRTDVEVTGDLSTYGVPVNKGDCITMIVDPGENAAYDGGKYLFVIEDANKTPTVAVGNNDNFTSLNALSSIEQGTDGWWFLEGTQPSNAKVLTKKTADGQGYESRRSEGLFMKNSDVHTGSYLDPIYQWLPGEDGSININGKYIKWGHNDSNPNWPDGVTVKVWHNNELIYSKKVTVNRGEGNDNIIEFNINNKAVKRGDKLSFQICHDGNWAWDGGNLSVVITPVEPAPTPADRDNNTVLLEDFSGTQGYEGWYYGFCDWDGKNFSMIAYDKANNRYYDGSAIELKKDYVAPGNGKNAAYKWIVAKDGTINVKGSYTKFANNGDPEANGTTVRIFVNGEEKEWMGAQGNFAEDKTSNFSKIFEVKAGDVIIFAVNPEGNEALDGGRLSVEIKDANPIPADRDNNTVLFDDFSGTQGYEGWYYGMCDWNSGNFNAIPYDASNERYFNDGKPELKRDFVEPGNDKNAAYRWVVAKKGKIRVTGEYVKFANSADSGADGVTVRIFINGVEEKWMGGTIQGNFSEDRSISFNEVYEVEAGDVLIFAVNPEGNDSYDGGKLSVTIKDASDEPEGEYTVTYKYDGEYPEEVMNTLPTDDQKYPDGVEITPKDPTSNTVEGKKDEKDGLWVFQGWKDKSKKVEGGNVEFTGTWKFVGLTANLQTDFSGTQNSNGWYYGMCDWKGENFEELPYNAEAGAYKNGDGKPELKADFVEPGSGRNAAYKWVVPKDGTIYVKGEYVKFANNDDSAADGTCIRIFINEAEKKWMGNNTMGNFAEERKENFNEKYEVKAGDVIIFAVNPEGNDSYDGGRISAAIYEDIPEEPEPERTNNTVLFDDFGDQGNQGWYYGSCDWNGTSFKEIQNKDGDAYVGENGLELKKDFVHPGVAGYVSAAYKWVAAEDGTIYVTGQYVKNANSKGDGTTFRIILNEDGDGAKFIDAMGTSAEDRTFEFNEKYEVKKDDVLIFAINPEDNNEEDGGKLTVKISDKPEEETERTNNTVLFDDFGDQGNQGWYYGSCDWNGTSFKEIQNKDGDAYVGENGLELKKDFVHPGVAGYVSAAYKWVAAEDGTIYVTGQYVKNANSKGDGTTFRIILNEDGDGAKFIDAMGTSAEDRTFEFNEKYEVKKDDVLIFAINPEDNNEEDGGKLTVKISDKQEEEPEPEPEKEYSVTYKYDKEYPEAVMNTLPTDDQKYKDGAEITPKAPSPTSVEAENEGKAGTWSFVSWDAETKTVKGADVEFIGSWTFTAKPVEKTITVSMPGNFSGTQGENNLYYISCEWDGSDPKNAEFDGEKYFGDESLELKANFIHPAIYRSAAYKYVVPKDGSIKITGEYVKFANNEGNGTTFRVMLNGDAVHPKFFVNTETGSEDRTYTFEPTFDVKKDDVILFAVNPEGNNSYDGGKVTFKIELTYQE